MRWTALAGLVGLTGCSQPEPAPTLGPPESLTLIRDEWGVPHIYAESEDAGYYGLGYAQAQDQGERVLRTALLAARKARGGRWRRDAQFGYRITSLDA